jgi:hypothetical protein
MQSTSAPKNPATLFLLFMNGLVPVISKGIQAALHADDLVLWYTDDHAYIATYRMQQAPTKLIEWTN